jgi:glycosyltransferase involved in cell wall biosynthesis
MASPPLVSVIIPCFNAEATLTDAILSVRRQTYPKIEIVAVDDGSRDGTLPLLRQYECDAVRVISQPNAGAAAARNAAIAIARGEVLAFLDADDTWHADKIALQMRAFESDPGVVLVGCRAEVICLDGRRLQVNPTREPPQGPNAWRVLLHHSFYVPSVLAARAAAVRRIGGFAARLRAGEDDQDFCIRMALEGDVRFVDAVLTTMHQQPGSLSQVHLSREHETVLPMIVGHCRGLADRLSRAELRAILGARYAQIGRNVYPGSPAVGSRLLLKAIFHGAEPLANARYLVTASPLARWAKDLLKRDRR